MGSLPEDALGLKKDSELRAKLVVLELERAEEELELELEADEVSLAAITGQSTTPYATKVLSVYQIIFSRYLLTSLFILSQ